MRWIFVLLLAVNVLYFGWELDRETGIRRREASAVTLVPASAQRLQLLSELPEPPVARASEIVATDVEPVVVEPALPDQQALVTGMPEVSLPGAEATAIVPDWHCFRYGPLLDEAQLVSLRNWFTARNIRAQSHYVDQQGRQLYWIYLAPQSSREDAMAVLQDMRSKGIGDFRLINRGDLQNAISLGVFSSREAVDSRLDELKGKGYVPVVVPYADVKRIHSLEVRVAGTAALLAEMQQDYPARFASEPVECGLSAGEDSPAAGL